MLHERQESQRRSRLLDAAIFQVMGPAGFELLAHIACKARMLQSTKRVILNGQTVLLSRSGRCYL